LNREPRPCNKVHAFDSQTRPDMVQADTFNRAAGDQWLQITAF
jgi:hypothetical protein